MASLQLRQATTWEALHTADQAIDQSLKDSSQRMMFKLFVDGVDIHQIARFAGVTCECVRDSIATAQYYVELNSGYDLNTLRSLCGQPY